MIACSILRSRSTFLHTRSTSKQEEDGTVAITKVELVPTSSGRKRFGAGTKTWKKHPLEDPTMQKFITFYIDLKGLII